MTPPVRRSRGRSSSRSPGESERILAGRAWVAGRLQPVELGIDGEGWIRSIGRNLSGPRRHDVGDAVILPAATDVHVHFRDPPGGSAVESIATGTRGAAVGGVGLVGDMPNTDPPVRSVDAIEAKEARVRGNAAVDVALYAALADPSRVAGLARRAAGFKLFLSPTTGTETGPTPREVETLLREASTTDLPVSVHAEDPSRFRPDRPAADPVGWDERRPPEAEASAVRALVRAPELLRLHVAHVTVPATVETLRRAGVSFEATPHHLLLSARAGADARAKVNPPLRSEAMRVALWTAFARGDVPCLASDHAPHDLEAKRLTFEAAPSGVPGVETMLPLLLARVRDGELALPTLVNAACDRPARWLGQPVGRLAPGHRADLVVVDFRVRAPIRARRLASPCGWSPFEGREAIFPREHWRRGTPIVQQGEYVGRPDGDVVRPEFAPGRRAAPEDGPGAAPDRSP